MGDAPADRASPPTSRERFTPAEKLRLGGEILKAYVRARRLLLRTNFGSTVIQMRHGEPRSFEGFAIPTAVRLGRVVQRALGAVPFDSRCLIRSLVLIRLLSARGIEGELVIGVASKPEFAAHAWVECQGVAVLPTDRDRFQRLAVF